ncbi:MAG: hypothetical protein HN403_13310 [Rhodospirillales bacterium]|nr:hypothetical protein [Rhodospirillales bacterium]
MALEFSSVSSTSIAVAGIQTLRGLSRSTSSGAIGLELPPELTNGTTPRFVTSVDAQTASAALTVAIKVGTAIKNSLGALAGALETADHESLVSSTTALTISGSRVSRVNVHAEASVLLEKIDTLIAANTFNHNANFISSRSGNILIQTSRYGGGLEIVPQALDTEGLGLSDLILLSKTDIDRGIAAVDEALFRVGSRVANLEALQRNLGQLGAPGQSLSRAIANGSDTLPRGSLVNLVA